MSPYIYRNKHKLVRVHKINQCAKKLCKFKTYNKWGDSKYILGILSDKLLVYTHNST